MTYLLIALGGLGWASLWLGFRKVLHLMRRGRRPDYARILRLERELGLADEATDPILQQLAQHCNVAALQQAQQRAICWGDKLPLTLPF